MKQFERHKTFTEICRACKARGFKLDTTNFDKHGSDYVRISGTFGRTEVDIAFNTFNGQFFGRTKGGVEFYSSRTGHDHKPWFRALLRFFYVPKKAAKSRRQK